MLAALLAAFLAGAPFAAGAAGHWASISATREAQAQRASLTQVTATLVRNGTRLERLRLRNRRRHPGPVAGTGRAGPEAVKCT